ncbi:MAG TPA: molybdenum cofactor biosynthesis protein MoaE [Gemmatimonadales bacterium]|nr:molybdenum cofactor biosynthesis protein MoaE [Gemmatimonadales bacterium]
MRIRVRLFARYREATGRERLEVDLPDGGTVDSAWTAVVHRHPELKQYRPYTLFAVGHDYVSPDHPLKSEDELCLFPPVSGGSTSPRTSGARAKPTPEQADTYCVVEQPLSPDGAAAAVDDPAAGGIVIFSGVVRNETRGRPVKFLEYEAHTPMAEAKLREIGQTVRARWPGVRRVAMWHRVGRLEIGEASVLIAVSAAHRQDAFEACKFAIDTLKQTVPVWKKEHFEDGEVWVGLQGG